MQVDEACMMVRSANPRVQAAGWALYAARDNDACKALRNAGVIARESLCGEKPEQQPATTSTRNVQVAYAKCELSGGKVVFRKKPGQDSAVARQQCLTSLGY